MSLWFSCRESSKVKNFPSARKQCTRRKPPESVIRVQMTGKSVVWHMAVEVGKRVIMSWDTGDWGNDRERISMDSSVQIVQNSALK